MKEGIPTPNNKPIVEDAKKPNKLKQMFLAMMAGASIGAAGNEIAHNSGPERPQVTSGGRVFVDVEGPIHRTSGIIRERRTDDTSDGKLRTFIYTIELPDGRMVQQTEQADLESYRRSGQEPAGYQIGEEIFQVDYQVNPDGSLQGTGMMGHMG